MSGPGVTGADHLHLSLMAKSKAIAKSEKRILITGGTGFLGTHIVRQFLDAGEVNLKVMASRVPEWMKDAGIKAVEGSVTDRDAVAKACKNVSAIFHLAGKVSRDNDDAAVMNKIHLEGTRVLCEAAAEAGVGNVILASSSGTIAVTEDEQVVDETYPQPIEILTRWSYYASKYYQERAAMENFNGEGRRLVFLNPSLLLGPDDDYWVTQRISRGVARYDGEEPEYEGPTVMIETVPLPFKSRAAYYRDGIRVATPSRCAAARKTADAKRQIERKGTGRD